MSNNEDLSFLDVTDLSTLSDEESDRRNEYWASKSTGERLREIRRLNVAKWGDKALGRMKRRLAWVQNHGTPDEREILIYSEEDGGEENK